MRLGSLISEHATLIGDAAVEVRRLALDSRAVEPGDLFAALPGTRTDGAGYVASAVERGAVAVLGGEELRRAPPPVPLAWAADPRRALAKIAADFFGRQPAVVVAVTGTNGKTSVATFCRQLWARMGHEAASLGTLGLEVVGRPAAPTLTTPDPITLHRLLSEVARGGAEHLCLEASSHGLEQRRLDGVRLQAAAFTNLTHDHLDYHGDLAAYRAAKLRLFDELLPPGAVAVVNADAPEAAALGQIARRRGLRLLDYGYAARALRLVEHVPAADGQRLVVEIEGRRVEVRSRLVGSFQAHNLLAAAGLVLASGAGPLDQLIASLAEAEGARGRMQPAARHASGATAFVDYAHTPDALEKALQALRPHTAGRLVVVFGCGGDRDRGKRPEMGAIAARLADRVIVTDDNPRGESPASIRASVLAAAPDAREIGDRAEAIHAGFTDLAAGDVLLVAGKGHETGQTVGDRVLPFDDREVLREAALATGGEPL